MSPSVKILVWKFVEILKFNNLILVWLITLFLEIKYLKDALDYKIT